MIYNLKIAEKTFKVDVGDVQNNIARVVVNGSPYSVKIENTEGGRASLSPAEPVQNESVAVPQAKPAPIVSTAPQSKAGQKRGAGTVAAPMPGLIVQIKVAVGDTVKAGQTVAVMEAMKMENDILAPISGTVQEIPAQKGTDVSTGEVIMVIG